MWYAALSKHSQILLETISFWPLALLKIFQFEFRQLQKPKTFD